MSEANDYASTVLSQVRALEAALITAQSFPDGTFTEADLDNLAAQQTVLIGAANTIIGIINAP